MPFDRVFRIHQNNFYRSIFTLNALSAPNDFVYHEISKIRKNLKAFQNLLRQKLFINKSFSFWFECVFYLSFHNFIVVFYVYICLKYFYLKSNRIRIEQHDSLPRRALHKDSNLCHSFEHKHLYKRILLLRLKYPDKSKLTK